MKKILFVSAEYNSKNNGIVTYINKTKEQLIKQGFDVYILGNVNTSVKKKKYSINYKKKKILLFNEFLNRLLSSYCVCKCISKLDKKYNFNIIECEEFYVDLFFYLFKKNKKKVITRVHSTLRKSFEFRSNREINYLDKKLCFLIEKIFIKKCDIVTTSTVFNKKYIEKFSKRKDIIVEPIIFNDYNLINEDVDNDLILFIGKLNFRKGIDILSKAMKIIIKKSNKKFIIIGQNTNNYPIMKNNYEMYIKPIIKSNKDRIFYYEYINDSLLKKLYKKARYVIVTSRYESYGAIYYEALIHKCICIALENEATDICLQKNLNILFKIDELDELNYKIDLFNKKDIEKALEENYNSIKKYTSYDASKFYKDLI